MVWGTWNRHSWYIVLWWGYSKTAYQLQPMLPTIRNDIPALSEESTVRTDGRKSDRPTTTQKKT
jgi:hypothetical protein